MRDFLVEVTSGLVVTMLTIFLTGRSAKNGVSQSVQNSSSGGASRVVIAFLLGVIVVLAVFAFRRGGHH